MARSGSRGIRSPPGRPNSLRCLSSRNPPYTLLQGCCCRSGSSSPRTKPASTGCRPMTVSASSAAGFRPPGSRPRWPSDGAASLTAAQVHALVLEGKTVVQAGRRDGVAPLPRHGGEPDRACPASRKSAKDRLKADGFFSEIISWKLRLFCPTDAYRASPCSDRLLARCPVTGLHARQGCWSAHVIGNRRGDLARLWRKMPRACVVHYLPAGRREGSYWMVGDLQNNPGRSLFVRLTWAYLGAGCGGQVTPMAPRASMAISSTSSARRTGITRFPISWPRPARILAVRRRCLPDAPVARRRPSPRAAHQKRFASLFAASVPVAGTLAETYLRSRGITCGA